MKGAMIAARLSQENNDKLDRLQADLSRKTRLPITKTCILEMLIEQATVADLARHFGIK